MTQVLASWVESGPRTLWRRTLRFVARSWLRNRSRLPDYTSPTYAELASIEEDLRNRGIGVEELIVAPKAFRELQARLPFPTDYHGGLNGGVFMKKFLEHHVAHYLKHTHACHYSTPEWTSLNRGDSGNSTHVRQDMWGIRASRKCSPETLIARVLNPAIDAGLLPSIKVFRNDREIDSSVYLHCVLAIEKPKQMTAGI